MRNDHCGATLPSQRRTVCSFIALFLPLLLLGLLTASTSDLSASPNRDISVCLGGPPQCDFAAIQPALDAAAPGDRVIVAPGVYTGQLTLKSGVALSSTVGAPGTTVRALQGPIVTGSGVVSATIRGITISGQGLLTGTVGIDLRNSEVSLADSVISDLNGRDGAQGAPNGETAIALRSDGASRLALEGVTIQVLRGGDGLADVPGGATGGDAIGILATGEAQVTVTRTTIRDLGGGAAGGGAAGPYSCAGQGGNARAIQTSGDVALTMVNSQVTGLGGGAPCHALAANCIFGAGAFTGISASGGSVLALDSRFEASFLPAAQNNPTGYGVLTMGTHETRLEGITITGASAGGAAVKAVAQAVGPDSPYCSPPANSFVGVASSGDELLRIAGITVSQLAADGPGGRASGVEASRVGDLVATRNQVSGLSGGYAGTTACGFDLSGVRSALVYSNRITEVHGGNAAGDLYYADPGYEGGSAVGVRVTAPATATIVSNVVAAVTAGAGTDMSYSFFPGQEGGDAIAVLLSDGPARIWNNTLYRTVAGAGGTGTTPGQPGQSAGLWVTRGASVRAANNVLVQHETGVLATEAAAARLSNNDLWRNAADYAGVAPGENDVHVAPGFVDANAYDFHVWPDSALIDAGLNGGPRLDDIDGEPRPQDGNADKVAVADIGADEYWPGLHGTMTVDPGIGHPGGILTYRIDLTLSTFPYAVPSVAIMDTLPPGLTYVPGSLSASGGIGGMASEGGGTIRWSGSVLAAGQPVVLTFQARVGHEPGPSSILNVAELNDGTPIPDKLSARAWIDPRTVYLPAISLFP